MIVSHRGHRGHGGHNDISVFSVPSVAIHSLEVKPQGELNHAPARIVRR
jgi:hypothetical protein